MPQSFTFYAPRPIPPERGRETAGGDTQEFAGGVAGARDLGVRFLARRRGCDGAALLSLVSVICPDNTIIKTSRMWRSSISRCRQPVHVPISFMFGFTRAGGSHDSPSSSTFLPFRPYAAASGGAEGGSRQEKASTSSRTSLTLQGLSFAFNKMRRHPSQAEGDKKSIGVRSSPVIMNGRFYNPWNTDAAMKTLGEVFKNSRRCARRLSSPSPSLTSAPSKLIIAPWRRTLMPPASA
ncbi:hypothetical protein Naga_101363g2 [Nannochloropsis gaditana]|uniref:Uncharacterized protein n=1 Tax=Nannochloropsis gaditana TaxID=72520 RepID=W7TH97_9STRA|nr:hypothetical protein Naga_101363g2 [Nannochloropsis gaditana]